MEKNNLAMLIDGFDFDQIRSFKNTCRTFTNPIIQFNMPIGKVCSQHKPHSH